MIADGKRDGEAHWLGRRMEYTEMVARAFLIALSNEGRANIKAYSLSTLRPCLTILFTVSR